MNITEILDNWANICGQIPWCLHGETLLCAGVLGRFPEELDRAVVAVWSGPVPGDLPKGLTVENLAQPVETVSVSCDGREFPAPANWREYLSETYGDYEQGFYDGIGVGLTAEEKRRLKAHQEKCREALAFLQQLSEKHGLRYYLLAGSVLGAVRHGGFIPWDDDIDIGIRTEDQDRFEALVRENLPPDFTLMQPGPNDPYPRMFSKICHDGRCCIDLWPLVPTDLSGPRAASVWYSSKVFTKLHYSKIGRSVGKFDPIFRPAARLFRDETILKWARHNERKYIGKAPTGYINLYSIYRRQKETIPAAWLDTPATAWFEGLRVPVVGSTEAYLTHLYGDYLRLPAPWKRASRHFERF